MDKESRWCWRTIDGYSDPVTYKLLYKFVSLRISNQKENQGRIRRVLGLQCVIGKILLSLGHLFKLIKRIIQMPH